MIDRELKLRHLRSQRSRSRFAHWSAFLLLIVMVGSWWVGDFQVENFLSERRLQNLNRFLHELVPYPLQGRDFDFGIAWEWAADVLAQKGWSATVVTLAISVAAIVLAGLGGALFSLPAARNFTSPEPFLSSLQSPHWFLHFLWQSLVWVTRLFLIFVRAIPEYMWAFLLLALLGPTAWPAVLALALHNLGILGKLGAEVVENTEPAPLSALRGLGASHLQIASTGLFPLTFSRFLLFLFYRWETCVREATVLGMLGIVSLGYWIQDSRARNHYDEMFFLVLLGGALVLIGDLLSALARESIRRFS
jgi:phosphonate transport system permease protein